MFPPTAAHDQNPHAKKSSLRRLAMAVPQSQGYRLPHDNLDMFMFDPLIAMFEGWLRAGDAWAPFAVFAVTFLESFPGVSILVPATAMLLGIGALVGSGVLEPGPVLIAAIGGAIVGDAIGFWLCRAFGKRLVQKWLPRSQRRNYARALLLFRRWGWAAIFFGRFLGPMRAVAPAVAGVVRMPEGVFQSANIASAIVWAPVMLLPGWTAAVGADAAAKSQNGVFWAVLVAVFVLGNWFLVREMMRRRLAARMAAAVGEG
ncbi:DedA family protein [Humitalea sp. 24SJ18S-53]|uniref:DedA family protein n=1 Tax=Humitalea sp. 24SJ18S-53 TaxID=3422307 RepID=UPI003D676FF8